MKPRLSGFLCAIASAALFGASFPLVKDVLDLRAGELYLAGLFYASQALVFLSVRSVWPASIERRLRGPDWIWLAGTALFGGLLAPALYLFGQQRVPAYVGSLLSQVEVVFTALIAIVFFRERLSRREALGIGAILAGATLLGAVVERGGSGHVALVGILLLLGASLMWGLDNNCTTRISHRDPLQIACIKGFVGGAFNITAGFAVGESLPSNASSYVRIAAIGVVCYGMSYVLIIYAMRTLGAARATALFGTSPVFGVALSWLVLHETISTWVLAGGVVIAVGMGLLVFKPRAQT